MRFFLCKTFNPQRQTLFRKSPFGLSPKVQGPSLHLIMFCAPLLYVLALDVVAMATVFYHSNRGNMELRGGDILAFAPSRLQLKVVFFSSCWKFCFFNFFYVLSFRELKESEDSQARWEIKVMRWVERWIKIQSHISFKPSCQIWWCGFSSLLHVWHYMSV